MVGAEALGDERGGRVAEQRRVGRLTAEREPAQEPGGEGVAAAGGVDDLEAAEEFAAGTPVI